MGTTSLVRRGQKLVGRELMRRREFLKSGAMAAATAAGSVDLSTAQETVEKPNIIIIIADQRHYGMSKATG